jgi:polar amino acid transport system substrate-binding protein
MPHKRLLFPLVPLAAMLALLAAPAAQAGCTRQIQMPVYAMGNLIKPVNVAPNVVKPVGAEVGGYLPDLFRKAGEKAGCDFAWSIVPRARLEAMFEAGQADVLLGATRTPQRDKFGTFVPIVTTRATLVAFAAPNPPIRSIAELLARREIKVALVRGQDYGPEFMAMSAELANQKRLVLESSINVARLLDIGAVDVTVMTPTVMAATLITDPKLSRLIDRMHMEPLAELGWNESGAYISKAALNAADRATLEELFTAVARSNQVTEVLKGEYPLNVLLKSNKLH